MQMNLGFFKMPSGEQIPTLVTDRSAFDAQIGALLKRPNPYRFFCTPYMQKFLSLAPQAPENDASDYESFQSLCMKLASAAGSGHRAYFGAACQMMSGHAIEGEDPYSDPDLGIDLWESLREASCSVSLEEIHQKCDFHSVTDETAWIFPDSATARKYYTFDAYLSAFSETIGSADMLYWNLNDFVFTSPHPYRAAQAFTSLSEGVRRRDLLSNLNSQLLRIAGEICVERNIPWIISGVSQERAALFAYLKKNDRLPTLLARISLMHPFGTNLSLNNLEQSGILPEIEAILPCMVPYTSETELQESLQRLFSRYPMSRVRYFMEGDQHAVEAFVGYFRFSRALDAFLENAARYGDLYGESEKRRVRSEILSGNIAKKA